MPETEIVVHVNGTARRARVEPRLTLADFIRERCHLTGTHLGCEHGVCGACTVLLDGDAVRACLVFAVQADGAEVTTIEGMSGPDGELSPVQAAFRDEHGLQCGFCTPGFVVSVTAFLRDNPNPTDAGDPRGALRQPVPLHRLPGHPPRHPGRRRRATDQGSGGRARDGGQGVEQDGDEDRGRVTQPVWSMSASWTDGSAARRRGGAGGPGTTAASRVVTTTAWGTSTSPIHAELSKRASEKPASMTRRRSVRASSDASHAPHVAVDAAALGRRVGGGAQALQERRAELEHRLDAAEAVGGGAQHQPGGALAVAVPDELRDRAAHRVADGDRPVDAEHVEGGDGVVGAVGQAHGPVGCGCPRPWPRWSMATTP